MSYSKCKRGGLSEYNEECLPERCRVRGLSERAWNLKCLDVRVVFGGCSGLGCPRRVQDVTGGGSAELAWSVGMGLGGGSAESAQGVGECLVILLKALLTAILAGCSSSLLAIVFSS